MKKKQIVMCFLLVFYNIVGFGQSDSTLFSISTIGIESNLLDSRRIISTPNSVITSSFYQDKFQNFGEPNRSYFFYHSGVQLGANIGVRCNFMKDINAEFNFGLGYQNTSIYTDELIKNTTAYNSSGIPYTFHQASIKMNYQFHEFYFSTAFLIKSEFSKINVFSGIGVNSILSKPTINVEEILLGNVTNKYKADNELAKFFNFFIPIGAEFNLTKTKTTDKGLKLRTVIALRAERRNPEYLDLRFFSSIGLALIYKL